VPRYPGADDVVLEHRAINLIAGQFDDGKKPLKCLHLAVGHPIL
jgi:hypothetical protein